MGMYLFSVLTSCLLTVSTTSHIVGTAYNIGKIQVDDEIPKGKEIFRNLAASCIATVDHVTTDKNVKVYTNQEEFIHEFAVGVGLTAKELGGKGDISAKYLKKSSTETVGTLIEVKFSRRRESISDECLQESELVPDILHDLRSLPWPIAKPHIRHAWLAYDAFVYKWGSHILKWSDVGAKAVHHSSKSSTSTENKAELKLKLCAKFPDLNLEGCVDKSPKKSSKTETSDETNDVSVVGGSRETQDQLRRGEFTPALLDKLSEEALDHPAPIEHHWISLPELLLSRVMFSDLDVNNRAEALVAYYKGYHMFGCDHQVVDGKNITVFLNIGSNEYPEFQCHQVPPGCQTDEDCKNWPFKFFGPCFCAGESCLAVQTKGIRKQTANELVVKRGTFGPLADPVNSRCHYSTRGCSCAPASLTEVWPLGSILLRSTGEKKGVNWVLICAVVLGLITALGLLVCVVRQGRRRKKVE